MKAQWHTKIIKVGNSFGVILPLHLLRLINSAKQGQWVKITLSPRGQTLLISRSKKPKF
jgi:antitoxin component of MazEF toxin-antitoxin module